MHGYTTNETREISKTSVTCGQQIEEDAWSIKDNKARKPIVHISIIKWRRLPR